MCSYHRPDAGQGAAFSQSQEGLRSAVSARVLPAPPSSLLTPVHSVFMNMGWEQEEAGGCPTHYFIFSTLLLLLLLLLFEIGSHYHYTALNDLGLVM